MMDRELAKVLIRNRKIYNFIWNWIDKPVILFYFVLTIIYIVKNKL